MAYRYNAEVDSVITVDDCINEINGTNGRENLSGKSECPNSSLRLES